MNTASGKTPRALLAVLMALLASGLITMAMYGRVESGMAAERAPLPVAVVTYAAEAGYLRKARYTGVVKAARDSTLGFEVAGTVDDLPAREGMVFRTGDVLAKLNTDRKIAQLNAAQAELDRIATELELAQRQRARIEDLVSKGLASQQAFDEARLGEQALEQARVAISARRDSAALEIEKSSLKAPFAGIVAERYAQQGTVLAAGTPVLQFIEQSSYEAHVGLPHHVSRSLQPGDSFTLSSGEHSVRAELMRVRADVDEVTLTVDAIFRLPPEGLFMTGETVVLQLSESVPETGGWLPLSALTAGERALWDVYTVSEGASGSVATREAVEILYSEGNRAFVRGTLANGALVIASGLHRLSPGAVIEAVVD